MDRYSDGSAGAEGCGDGAHSREFTAGFELGDELLPRNATVKRELVLQLQDKLREVLEGIGDRDILEVGKACFEEGDIIQIVGGSGKPCSDDCFCSFGYSLVLA